MKRKILYLFLRVHLGGTEPAYFSLVFLPGSIFRIYRCSKVDIPFTHTHGKYGLLQMRTERDGKACSTRLQELERREKRDESSSEG